MTSLEGKDETREKTDTERGSYLDKTDVKTEKRDTESYSVGQTVRKRESRERQRGIFVELL